MYGTAFNQHKTVEVARLRRHTVELPDICQWMLLTCTSYHGLVRDYPPLECARLCNLILLKHQGVTRLYVPTCTT